MNKLVILNNNFFNIYISINIGNILIFMIIKCRKISKGKSKGKLIVSDEPLSFLGGVNPETGEIIDLHHELKGKSIKDKILFIPGGKGSTVGSYVIFQMKKNHVAPKAIICKNAEPIIATGAIISDIPMVDSPSSDKELKNNMEIEVNADKGEIILDNN